MTTLTMTARFSIWSRLGASMFRPRCRLGIEWIIPVMMRVTTTALTVNAPFSRSVLSIHSTYRRRSFAMCSVRATFPVSRLWCRTPRSRPRSAPTLTVLLRPVICLVTPVLIGISIVRPPCLPTSTSSRIGKSFRRLGFRPRISCPSRDPTLTLVLVSLKARFTTPLVSGMDSHYLNLVTTRG